MKRLTTDDPQDNMQTSLNLFYARDGWTWVRGGRRGGPGVPLNDYIRRIYAAHCPDSVPLPEDDDDLSDLMYGALFDGPEEMTGLIATLYEAAWASCGLRERLKAIEDILGDDYDLEKLKEMVQEKGEMDAARPGEWISVKERLLEEPERSDNMVLAIVDGTPHENITLVSAYLLANYDLGAVVSYWMPLPEPPAPRYGCEGSQQQEKLSDLGG